MAVCDVCGLPEELCVCEEIAREVQKIKVYSVRLTVIEGIDSKNIALKELVKGLKTDCACGGTYKDGRIELQGAHTNKVKDALIKLGFSEESIQLSS
jgi:translation initiation factor 1